MNSTKRRYVHRSIPLNRRCSLHTYDATFGLPIILAPAGPENPDKGEAVWRRGGCRKTRETNVFGGGAVGGSSHGPVRAWNAMNGRLPLFYRHQGRRQIHRRSLKNDDVIIFVRKNNHDSTTYTLSQPELSSHYFRQKHATSRVTIFPQLSSHSFWQHSACA